MIEFVLSTYAYHNYCTEVLKELEPQVNELFAQTKVWRSHYEREMKLWDKLHIAVKKNVLAEFQHNMGFIPEAMEASPTWLVDHTPNWGIYTVYYLCVQVRRCHGTHHTHDEENVSFPK